jgi:uncharacterized membrane-anchored protein
MRKAFIVAAIIMQVLVLAYMAGEREYILKTGKVIHLRTAPIDPRDIFRGDYVRLNYEISRIAIDDLKDAEDFEEIKKGQKLYVGLQEGPDGLFEMTQAQLIEPEAGLYLTGRSPKSHPIPHPGYPIWANYGIEAYFVEQGAGRAIEKRRGNRNEAQVPVEMSIAVGRNGKAVISGYRWSPLGIGLQVLRNPTQNTQPPPVPTSVRVRLTLVNASDQPQAIVNLPDACSFALEPVPWAKQQWTPVHDTCGSARPTDSDVIVLVPGQETSFVLDFAGQRWQVEAEGNISQIGTLDWTEQFRMVYRPPDEKNSRHLEQRDLIWHGYLPTRVFHGRGQID